MAFEKEILAFPTRGRIDIIGLILEASVNGARKTSIMYRANMSFRQLRTYLPWLIQRGLLEVIENQGIEIYKITKKGLAFLEAYRNLQAVISS